MIKINSFSGEYSFLSNFYNAKITYEGLTFSNSEAAFQAMKTTSKSMQEEFCSLNASQAKRLGKNKKKIQLRPDWEQIKDKFMYEIVKAKFEQNPELREKLISTNNVYLEEGNTWGDTTWGTVDGVGENRLGKILMQVRDEIL